MKLLKGIAKHVRHSIVGKLTRHAVPILARKDFIFFGEGKPQLGYCGLLSTQPPPLFSVNPTPAIYSVPEKDAQALQEGDIVLLNPNGDVNVLWDASATDNALLVTERCNCQCIICPQPPRQDFGHLHRTNARVLRLLEPEGTGRICLTGGEPTLNKERFLELLALCRTNLPGAQLEILTNAQSLSNFDFANKAAELTGLNTTFCVSLHADTADLHNAITGTKDGFKKTVLGIHNLAKLQQKVEIRFVINRLNFPRLVPFSIFVYRNFPFVVHVAFMGLEMTGWAFENRDEIWIDPWDYREELRKAIKELHRRDIDVSIYNLPLCLLERSSWRYAKQSISGWKNDYLPICASCDVRGQCCGVFTSSKFHSPKILPVLIANS